MITPSNEIKTALSQPVKTVWATVLIGENDDTITIGGGDNLASVELEGSGGYFRSASTSGKIKVIGTDYGDLAGQPLSLVINVYTNMDETSVDTFNQGQYYIKSVSVDMEKGLTTFEVYDAIGKMRETDYSSQFNYPTTVAGLAEQLADLMGLTILTDLTTLPNYDYAITEDLWATIDGTTIRDILEQIAGATATIVRTTSTGALEFIPPHNTGDDSLTYANLKKFKFGEAIIPYNTVTLAREPANDTITVEDAVAVERDGRSEVKLSNNEILDDSRETMATPILNAVSGFAYRAGEMETEGHGYYQIGDMLTVSDGEGTTWNTVITSYRLKFAGNVKETIKSVPETYSETDYSATGSIYKSVWNTQIKVDKQANEIISIVERQDITDQTVADNYTQILQNLTSIVQTIQTTGGANLLRNSVGYDKDNSGLAIWAEVGDVSSATFQDSLSAGAVSGNAIILPAGASITQRVNVSVDGSKYSLSARVFKSVVGSASITLTNSVDDFSISIPDQQGYSWGQVRLEGITPAEGYWDVTIANTSASTFYITDLMLSAGDTITPWQQASSEILNTQVALTEDGVRVKSSVYEGDYTQITPLEFAGYSSASGSVRKVFSLNRDTTQVYQLEAESGIDMPPIKIVPISSGQMSGWSFVKTG